ncbi:MAG: insulinase family protein, partial [Myxococcota bacterium]
MSSARQKVLVETSDVLPMVDIEIAFPIGSLQDPIGKEGLARLTGHLVRRGPRGMSTTRFEERLARIGARMSVDASMRTTRIRATTLRRNLEALLALVADLVWDPALRATDFAKLKRQTQASLLARLDDDQALGAVHFRERLFSGHPYGRPSGGSAASLRRISLRDVERFYGRYYEKGAYLVGFAGDITKADARALADRYFPKRAGKP